MAIQIPLSRSSGSESSAPTTAAMTAPIKRGDEHGHVEAVGELEDGEPTDGGEGALAQRDVARRSRSSR